MNKILYIGFGVQALLLVLLLPVGLAAAQNQTENSGLALSPSGDIPTHQAVANLTNATSNPQDIEQMKVIGGTVNATLNESSGGGGGMTGNESGAGPMTSNMTSNMSSMGGMNQTSNMTG